MPTLRSDICVSAGSGGDSGDVAPANRGLLAMLASRALKYEVIDGWYGRLRMWPALPWLAADVVAMAVALR